MNLRIPVYIETFTDEETPGVAYSVRPLLVRGPVVRSTELAHAVERFTKAFRRQLNRAGRSMSHEELAYYTYFPDFDEQTLKLDIELRNRTARCVFLMVTFDAFGRRIAFTPSIPGLWFDVRNNEDLGARAAEVYREYFRSGEKQKFNESPRPEDVTIKNRAWLSVVEVRCNPPLLGSTPRDEIRAMLGGNETPDGEVELERVGRCIDWGYPNDLNRVESRDAEVDELTRILNSRDRRPVLLIGPRSVGKTAIIEEYVYRSVENRKSKFPSRNAVWLIAPQRLISGMSLVGQWENRLLAVIDEVRKSNHILYFDDLLGLFKAGISRDSNLNVAQVLKPFIEKREIRVVGEVTVESWRILRELDRGFADLFHLLPVAEPDELPNLRMLIGLTRRLEQLHKCRFKIDALPAVIDLQRRYVRDSAFPGKAAAFLQQLAVKFAGADIDRAAVLAEFQAKSGLGIWFVEGRSLDREEVTGRLGREIVGQRGAIEAIADCIALAKAGINDPERPMASFLFLGPTGVGKTQCAKSLASFLFGDTERLLRFDMNEFFAGTSIVRLIGTFDQPDGQLTGAVRRQPFSVILFDEVEKAHPDFFNLLLQVMGEGRLTDAVGRTADFTNTILIMTSNLGVREASSEMGFNLQRINESSIYRLAAEKFFRPEFFNRIDRIVPFERLNRQAIESIATGLISGIFRREGLIRRRYLLEIEDEALSRIVDAGFHPQLGARALKRAIEREIMQPIAARLCQMPPGSPAILRISSEGGALGIGLHELLDARPFRALEPALISEPRYAISCAEDALQRIEEELDAIRPEGSIELNAISSEHRHYFAMREQFKNVRLLCDRIAQQLEAIDRGATSLARGFPRAGRPPSCRVIPGIVGPGSKRIWKDLFAAEDANMFLHELTSSQSTTESRMAERIGELIREIALLSLLSSDAAGDETDRAMLSVRPLGACSDTDARLLIDDYLELFEKQLGFETSIPDSDPAPSLRKIMIAGRGASRLAAIENGSQLCFKGGQMGLLQVKAIRFMGDGSADDFKSLWAEGFDPVNRISFGDGGRRGVIDLRSGLGGAASGNARDLRAFVLSAIEPPPEFSGE